MQYDIFLSYRRSDQPIARALVAELEKRGIAVWWDQLIDGGQDWRDAIVAGLETSGALVILFSEDCNASKQLKKELAIADTLDKTIVPVLIEDTQPKGHFLYELASRNWLQMYPEPHKKAAKLADRLAATLDIENTPAPGTEAPSALLTAPEPGMPPSTQPAPAPRAPTEHQVAKRVEKTVEKTKAAKAKNKKLRDFLPFKWIDIIPVVGGFVAFMTSMGGFEDMDYNSSTENAGQWIGIGSLMAAVYGAVVFPIRYFMRKRRVWHAALMYTLSSIVLFILFLGGLLAYEEGDIGNMRSDDIVIGLVIWAILGVTAIILYAILHGVRTVRAFRKNVEVL